MFSCLPGALRISTRNDFVLKSFVNAVASSLCRERGRIIPELWHRVRRAVLRPLLSPEGVQKDHGRGRQPYQPLANPLQNFVGPLRSDKPRYLVFLRFCRAANSQLGSARLASFA